MLSPPPRLVGEGGAGGYAPSPNTAPVSGGVTPQITSSPRTKPRGTLEPPWKVPESRFFATAALLERAGSPSYDHTLTALGSYAHAAPPLLRVWPMEKLRMARPAQAWQLPVQPGLDAWEEGAAPLPTSLFPWTRRTTARPIDSEMWWAAASLWVSAALFCLVTDTLEMEVVTSSLQPTNRKCSRGEAFLPLQLCFFTRVSERERAEGVGEVSSTVARMSGEAPPPCLYIKGWRGARRRHFALEWSSL